MAGMNQLSEFAARSGCFPDWSQVQLQCYLLFHTLQGTLVSVSEGGVLIGLAIGWRCDREDLNQYLRKRWNQWPQKPNGKYFFVSPLIASSPGALSKILIEYIHRFPWQQLTLCAVRRGRLTVYPRRILDRLYTKSLRYEEQRKAA